MAARHGGHELRRRRGRVWFGGQGQRGRLEATAVEALAVKRLQTARCLDCDAHRLGRRGVNDTLEPVYGGDQEHVRQGDRRNNESQQENGLELSLTRHTGGEDVESASLSRCRLSSRTRDFPRSLREDRGGEDSMS